MFVPFVSALECEPSGSHSQTFSAPLRSVRKTMRLPSGDHRGCESNAGPEVIRVAVPPVTGMVYRSPRSSKTIVLPSGETSSDIHVASDVSKLTVRVVFSGNESSLTWVVSRLVVSCGGGGGGCWKASNVATTIESIGAPDGRNDGSKSDGSKSDGRRCDGKKATVRARDPYRRFTHRPLPSPYLPSCQMLSARTCRGAGSCDRNTIRMVCVSMSISHPAMRGRTNSAPSSGVSPSGVASRNSISFIRHSR